jgi:hypothetical protein
MQHVTVYMSDTKALVLTDARNTIFISRSALCVHSLALPGRRATRYSSVDTVIFQTIESSSMSTAISRLLACQISRLAHGNLALLADGVFYPTDSNIGGRAFGRTGTMLNLSKYSVPRALKRCRGKP